MASTSSDGPAAYAEQVRTALQERGWELDTTHVSDDVYLLGGPHQQHDEIAVVIISAGTNAELSDEHLRLATQARAKYNADTAMVHCRGSVPNSVRRQAENSEIKVLDDRPVVGTEKSNQKSSADQANKADGGKGSTRSRRAILSLMLLAGIGGGGWLFLDDNETHTSSPSTTANTQQDTSTDESGNEDETTETGATESDMSWIEWVPAVESRSESIIRIDAPEALNTFPGRFVAELDLNTRDMRQMGLNGVDTVDDYIIFVSDGYPRVGIVTGTFTTSTITENLEFNTSPKKYHSYDIYALDQSEIAVTDGEVITANDAQSVIDARDESIETASDLGGNFSPVVERVSPNPIAGVIAPKEEFETINDLATQPELVGVSGSESELKSANVRILLLFDSVETAEEVRETDDQVLTELSKGQDGGVDTSEIVQTGRFIVISLQTNGPGELV
ncbi:hypothetical protein [Halorientalis salina]|uniref:hypothetical protein n=1 Tax=Halorientalis salina TaxID=2932266 RepID=UPI0010AD6A72|nr:hypothetical protein [Halorientalis salina]